MLNNVEADSLGKGAALADGNDISLLDGVESGRQVGRDVAVALLETSVLRDEVEVVTTENDGTLHLVGDDDTTENTAADSDTSGPGALVVDVLTVDSSSGSLDTQTNVLVPAGTLGGAGGLGLNDAHTSLLLESLLGLDVHF